MADGTEAPPRPEAPDGVPRGRQGEPLIELSERGRSLIEETAELVVELPD